MANLGVHIYEQATSVSTPLVADSGIPFVAGLAPSHAAASPGKAYTPVLCTSWKEAVEKLGFSYDWDTYTLCEFMYSHFQLFGCQPVIFCYGAGNRSHQKFCFMHPGIVCTDISMRSI